MSKGHLTYFKVENFKRFDLLELTDIGQFNLIVGNNNVGKTSLLEALLITEDGSYSVANLRSSIISRGISFPVTLSLSEITGRTPINKSTFNYFDLLLKNREKPILATLSMGTTNKNSIKITQNKDKLIYSVDNKSHEYNMNVDGKSDYTPFVPYALSIGDDLVDYYSHLVNHGRVAVKNFMSIIKFFIPNLEEVTINSLAKGNAIFLGLEGVNDWLPIQTFGDGTKRLFRMALEISECTGNRLMIDEIDAGIHYSKMRGFLKTVFQMALKNDVQLFMTTHSLECQQAFAEVFEESDMAQHQDKVRQFTLVEKQDGQVAAITRNFAQLEFALQTDNETRGGN